MEPFLESDLRGLIPSSLLPLWRRRGIESFLPFQRRAVRETGLFHGHNLLVLAPSSAGKTLIAELALARALASGRRALFLSPTRALAEQEFAALASGLARTGLRVVCSTSDRPESDAEVAAGRFDLLVAVYEKLSAFLATDSRLLAGVGAVAVDEIQTLADPERGPVLDLLVTRMLRSAYAPQVVALGAPMANPDPLVDWLGADLLETGHRPHVLREGVLIASSGQYRHRSSGDRNSARSFDAAEVEGWASPAELERLQRRVIEVAETAGLPCGEEVPLLLAAAAHRARDHGPLVLFAPTRRLARRWAGLLARLDAGFPPARVALAALEQSGAAGRIRRCLKEALATGVAFHHADLEPEARACVEAGFESGEIWLLLSTPTLGIGVNLPVRTVFHTPWRLGSALELPPARDSRTDPAAEAPLTLESVALPLDRARFLQQGGRAGRFGRGDRPGDSVLVAPSEAEARRLWDRLMDAPSVEFSRPPLGCIPIQQSVLGLLGGGTRRSAANLAREFGATFSARLLHESSRLLDMESVESVLPALEKRNFVRRGEDGLWGLTGLGEISLHASLPPSTLEAVQRALEADSSEVGPPALRECVFLLRLALTPEGSAAASSLPFARRRPPLPLPDGLDPTDEGHHGDWGLDRRAGGFTAREIRAWCTAAALCDWGRGFDTLALEDKYDVEAGGIRGVAESFSRLVSAAARLVGMLEPDPGQVRRLGELADRLTHGVDASGLPLARLRVPGLSRDAVMRLVAEGCGDPAGLGGVAFENLLGIVTPDVAHRLRAASAASIVDNGSTGGPTTGSADPVARPQRPRSPLRETSPPHRSGSSPIPLLEIHLQSPGIVRAAGYEVRLPPLGFDLLVALAERPGEVVTRDALYQRLWPEGGPEDQQLDAHRRRLIDRLRPALGEEAASIGQVVRGIGFRLALDAACVRVRRDSPVHGKSGCAPRPAPG